MATAATELAEGSVDIADLVCTHQADVWRYLRFLGCDLAEADDLVQETFLCIVRKPLQQRSPAETAAYLRTVARRQLLMARRRQDREPLAAEIELAESVWAAAMGGGIFSDYLDALEDCLESAVTPRVRAALALRYADDASREKIAHSLDMTADGVKTMLRRARSALRACIERKTKQ